MSLQHLGTQLPYLPRTCRLVWTAAGHWTLIWAGLLLAQGVLPVAVVYLTRATVDHLVAVTGNGGASLSPLVVTSVCLAAVLVLVEMLRSVTEWVHTAQAEQVRDYLQELIQDQASTLDLSFYESSAYYDRLHQARSDAIGRPVAMLENAGASLQHSLTLIGMAGVLLAYGWWLPVVLLLGALPALMVVFRTTIRQYEWQMHTTADRRRCHYFDWLLTSQEAAAELRLFGLSAYFRTAFRTLRQRLRTERLGLLREQSLAELAAGVVNLSIAGLVMLWMLRHAVQGLLTLGEVVLIYQAFQQGQRLVRTLLTSVRQIYSNMLFLDNLFSFLKLESRLPESHQPIPMPVVLQQGLRLNQVTFRYPGSPSPTLEQFSLDIPAGHTIALVGSNGAGKSTVLKLLCRFYDPEAGSVTLDGIDLRDVSSEVLRQRITVLFQHPVQYQSTAADNIALGCVHANPSQADLAAAAHAAGADTTISRLPQGYDTTLGKWFGNAELSTGEWQRIALARAFLRQSPIVILDEPTSAMDSWAESIWLERFRQLAKGRTVVMITHRFTTAMHADRIHVMDAGRIVESGSHLDLVAQGGAYAQSWTTQMQAHHMAKTTV
jgi:ATP-binding cassette subfamily B protein